MYNRRSLGKQVWKAIVQDRKLWKDVYSDGDKAVKTLVMYTSDDAISVTIIWVVRLQELSHLINNPLVNSINH